MCVEGGRWRDEVRRVVMREGAHGMPGSMGVGWCSCVGCLRGFASCARDKVSSIDKPYPEGTEHAKSVIGPHNWSAVRGRTEEKESDYPQHEGGCYIVELFRVHRRTAY